MEWKCPLHVVATILDEAKKDGGNQELDVSATDGHLENNVCRQFATIFVDQAI